MKEDIPKNLEANFTMGIRPLVERFVMLVILKIHINLKRKLLLPGYYNASEKTRRGNNQGNQYDRNMETII
jgi:hypothetical protein